MADEADNSQERLEREEELRRLYQKPFVFEILPTGNCLNCGEELSGDKRWCDIHCRTDWQNRTTKK